MADILGKLHQVKANFTMVSQLSSIANALVLISILFGLALLCTLILFDKTDIPYIRNMPSVPAHPIFGNLFQLGAEHPKRLAEFSRRYGPVFQIRLGNKVRQPYLP